ncbi:hypothetical protein CPB84DRAFT_1780768 [Gymnopilus junonius]|uniref:Uncharacterized protein n=1 Tax=Gymnopilus junonius TaxID=109634 RepID=A0A9P5TMS8_GYMJU|nr:hypothetical protein CPB84DRAFT_1780768 [Gymnopilus junonius]
MDVPPASRYSRYIKKICKSTTRVCVKRMNKNQVESQPFHDEIFKPLPPMLECIKGQAFKNREHAYQLSR